MRFVGMLRVKNEARWIERVIRSILPLCEHVFILDDHSTDATPEIASSFDQVTVFESPFTGLDETRDKRYLLDRIVEAGGADYVLAIDGDEELEASGPHQIRALVRKRQPPAVNLRVIYLWNSREQWRTDGVYGRFYRPSVFRLDPGNREFQGTTANGNLHCTNVPASLIPYSIPSEIRLLHYGYMEPEVRARKHEYYNRIDPGNANEDFYRHITQGDAGGLPASEKLLHAGPLKLERV